MSLDEKLATSRGFPWLLAVECKTASLCLKTACACLWDKK